MQIKKILIVEDSELLHRMYDLILMRYKATGANILHSYNGMEGWDLLLANADVDIILLDINMPIMDGIEFLKRRRLEKAFLKIPVIIISTEGKEDDTALGLRLGANTYLTKPFQPPNLLKMIETLIDQNAATAGNTILPSRAVGPSVSR